MSSKCSAASINKVVNKCVRELGPPTGNMAEYGTRLGNLVVRELRRAGVGIRGTRRVRANRALRTMLGFPAELANETIESFIYRTLRYHMDDYEPLFEGTRRNGQKYKRKIGNLMPDLLIELPDGSFIIWDLTSKTAEEHLLKTLLYARVASVASGGRLMRIGSGTGIRSGVSIASSRRRNPLPASKVRGPRPAYSRVSRKRRAISAGFWRWPSAA